MIDGHQKARPDLILSGAGEPVGGEKRRGWNAVASGNRVQRLAIGDDDRRAAGGGPTRGRSTNRLRLRERRGVRPDAAGAPCASGARRHPGRRRGVGRVAREWIGERAVALRKAGGVGRTSRQQEQARSLASARCGNARPFNIP